MPLRAVHEIFEEIRGADVSDRAVQATMRAFFVVGLVVSVWWSWTVGTWTSLVTWSPALIAALLWGLAAWAPVLLRPLHLVWMTFALVLGFFMTRVILFLVFFTLVTPIGLVMRILGRDPLDKGTDKDAASWWIRRPPSDLSKRERLTRLF